MPYLDFVKKKDILKIYCMAPIDKFYILYIYYIYGCCDDTEQKTLF